MNDEDFLRECLNEVRASETGRWTRRMAVEDAAALGFKTMEV